MGGKRGRAVANASIWLRGPAVRLVRAYKEMWEPYLAGEKPRQIGAAGGRRLGRAPKPDQGPPKIVPVLSP